MKALSDARCKPKALDSHSLGNDIRDWSNSAHLVEKRVDLDQFPINPHGLHIARIYDEL